MTESNGFDIPVSRIDHGENPRLVIDSNRLKDLTDSVKQHGVLQPIRVRPDGERYVIIAGHRRFEAAKTAGLEVIPAIIAEPTPDEAYVQSLVENLQREDLDPLDEAKAFRLLLEQTGWTQAELGTQVGRKQPEISNALALLRLPSTVQKQLSDGDLTVGHAKVLAYMPSARQEEVAKRIVDDKLTVREAEGIAYSDRTLAEARVARDKRVLERAAELRAALKDSKIPKNATVIEYDTSVVAALADVDYNVRPINYNTDATLRPPKDICNCTAVVFNNKQFEPACIKVDHQTAERTAKSAALASTARKNEAKVEKGRRTIASALRAQDEDAFTSEGLRLALYHLLGVRDDSGRIRISFVRSHGGTVPTADTSLDASDLNDAVWGMVETLPIKDVADEVVNTIADLALPNVFAVAGSQSRLHAAVRQWVVGEFKLDTDLVWGNLDWASYKPLPTKESEPMPEPVAEEPVASTVESLIDAFKREVGSDLNEQTSDVVLATGAAMKDGAPEPVGDAPLEGEMVVVTGVVEGMDRNAVMAAVVNAGGQWSETISKNVTLLVIGDKPGATKVKKAESLAIPTITEAEFRARLAE